MFSINAFSSYCRRQPCETCYCRYSFRSHENAHNSSPFLFLRYSIVVDSHIKHSHPRSTRFLSTSPSNLTTSNQRQLVRSLQPIFKSSKDFSSVSRLLRLLSILPTQSPHSPINMAPSKVTRSGHEIAREPSETPMYSTRSSKRKASEMVSSQESQEQVTPSKSSRRSAQKNLDLEVEPPAKRARKSTSSEVSEEPDPDPDPVINSETVCIPFIECTPIPRR